ncbi:MAG TPA: PPOX class F420-dependent oxidoreductase [Anaerolineae bacterium]|nr:PPOX class F420-dependent oxidoreductase [Anaerolineae bacterium]
MTAFSDKQTDFLNSRVFAHLATIMPDGSPQVTPVWIDFDGDYILVNTAEGRAKERNMRRDGRVALSIMDPDEPYTHLDIRGHVAEITHDDAEEHIDTLSQRYDGKPWTVQPGQVRVIFKIAPDSITGNI